ncbi:MAG: CBS domain-containing protein [Rhodobacteraceae bacterium]|nr:CBS domain-containing protein [Paracoccaceae bacterium]
MLVKQILDSKPSSEVLTIDSTSRLSQAAQLLSSMGVGALVVSADGKTPDGILSERDIVREIGRNGSGVLAGQVANAMSENVVCCRPDDTADNVLSMMTERRFRHMPVVDSGRMIGLISIGDVVKARLDELNLERDALEGMITGH